jgi:hypothetical protein
MIGHIMEAKIPTALFRFTALLVLLMAWSGSSSGYPRDTVGGDVQKLRRMDAMVHIFYKVAGTSGAFCTALALIPRLGNNMSFTITPIFFTLASAT